MITTQEYTNWVFDPTRDSKRIYLVELEYSDDNTIPGHGRDSRDATLNPVESLRVQAYTNNLVDVLFVQPVQQEGYVWSIWVDGEQIQDFTGGAYTFSASVGKTYRVAVSSDKGGRYSDPYIVEFTHTGEEKTVYGSRGVWENIGAGKGGDGAGKIRLSWPSSWVDESGRIYDDFITSDFYIEKDIDSFNSVGDFKATNLANDLDWQKVYWRGHKCTVLRGDIDWPREDFFVLAQNLIQGCRKVRGKQYQFDLMDGGMKYRRKFQGQPPPASGTLISTLSAISREESLESFGYYYLSEKASFDTYLEIDEDTVVEDVARKMARSVNADFAMDNFEFKASVFQVASDVFDTYTKDHIIRDSVREIGAIPASKQVVMKLASGAGEVSSVTSAATGEIRDTYTVDTALTDAEQAGIVLGELVKIHSRPRSLWELKIYTDTGFIYIGKIVRIEHEDLTGWFKIKKLRHWPMKRLFRVEVEQHYPETAGDDFTASIELVYA